ncbi:MAG: ATP-binding cassette domain-containing protein [Desulfobulbus sp.]|nr:MAG: ATP-binding cassette domain-containing protein [Desulfobulbus sp.]
MGILMHTLLSRFRQTPLLTVEVLAASLLISLFNLALPIFVIQLLNRYVSHGFEGTLYTLTFGVLLAIFLQYGFRIIRTALLARMNEEPEKLFAENVLHALAVSRFGAVVALPRELFGEVMNDIRKVQAGWEPANLIPLIDIPFVLLYLAALALLSPLLALIALIGTGLGLAAGAWSLTASNRLANRLTEMFTAYRARESKALGSLETLRAFNGADYLAAFRREKQDLLAGLRQRFACKREQGAARLSTLGSLQSVCIYSVGAVLVVQGELNVGILIGANILASRAFQSVAQLFRSVHLFREGERSRQTLEKLAALPSEKREGIALRSYSGRLRLADVAFGYVGGSGPLFESLSLTLEPGRILVVTGGNGTGKTTLARLLVGLLDCGRGEILADEVNLRQLAMPWWRHQLLYLPQEPDFLLTTIRENICLAGPVDEARLNQAVRAAGLRGFLDRTADGLETLLSDPARIPPGIRKRIALARALVTDGPLVIFDEPTEALDPEGCALVYNLLNQFAQSGKTMVICGNDPYISKAAHLHLDLNHKPVPRLSLTNDHA